MKQLVIIDYGMGNLESILNAFRRLGVHCAVSKDPKTISAYRGIILPGVGSFSAAMLNLERLGFIDTLNEEIRDRKKPFLGICLGMQLVAEDSTEGHYCKGLGWIRGHVIKIETSQHLPVPHVGWNEINYNKNCMLFKNIAENGHFFFDHSYHLECADDIVAATCDYGGQRVACIQKENIFAVQFHPEKSQRNGAKLLRNFVNFVDQNN